MTTTELQIESSNWPIAGARADTSARVRALLARHADAVTLIGLVVLAIAARAFITRGLWLDEATSVSQAKMDFGRMLSYMRQSDVHPPLFQTLLWFDIRIFGTSEFAVRLPSLVIGSALVPMLYLTGREIFDRRAGLLAAFIGAIGPAAIWYSQEARMYPMFMLFAVTAVWAQVRCVRAGGLCPWAVYTVATAALLWTQYFTVLHVIVQQLAFVVMLWRGRGTVANARLFAGWWRSLLAITLLVAPLISIPLGQIQHYGQRDTTTIQANGSVSSGAPVYTAISNVASALIGYHSDSTMTKINALWPLGMLAGLLALGRGRTRSSLLLVAVVAFPMAVLFLVGLERNDVFELRYFAGTVPAMALLIARAITLLAPRRTGMIVACSALVLSLGAAVIDEQRDGSNARLYDFRTVLTEVNADARPGDLMLYEPFYLHPTVHYYAPAVTSFPLVVGLESTTAPKRIVLVGSLAFAEKERSAERIAQVVDRLSVDRKLVQHVQRNHIEVWVFE